MKIYTYILFVLMSVTFTSARAQSKNIKTSRVYMYAMGNCISDSVVYFSEVLELENVPYNNKNMFLYARSEYSNQFREHLTTKGVLNATVVTSFGFSRTKAEKKFINMKKKLEKSGYLLKYVPANEFNFTVVEYNESE